MKLIALFCLVATAAFAATEENLDKTFTATPGGQLVVKVDFGSIDVRPGDADKVVVNVWRKVTRKSEAEEQEYLREGPVNFIQEGNTITVESKRKAGKRSVWSWGFGQRTEGKYTVRVPAHFSVRLNTSGGGISVKELEGAVEANTSGGGLSFAQIRGPLKGDTSGGGIEVADSEGKIEVNTSGGGITVKGGGGSLKADTSGGAITVKRFAGPARVGTSGGGITIEDVAGEVCGDTSGGPIHAVLPAPVPGHVELSTSGGGVTVRVPESAAFQLDAETSGGGTSCELPITIEGKKEHDRLKGTVNGGETLVRLRSSGGGIQVKKL